MNPEKIHSLGKRKLSTSELAAQWAAKNRGHLRTNSGLNPTRLNFNNALAAAGGGAGSHHKESDLSHNSGGGDGRGANSLKIECNSSQGLNGAGGSASQALSEQNFDAFAQRVEKGPGHIYPHSSVDVDSA